MNYQYLLKDFKSFHSSRFYGRKGDKVIVLNRDISGLIKVMNTSGKMYFIGPEYLSMEPVEKDIEPIKLPVKKKR